MNRTLFCALAVVAGASVANAQFQVDTTSGHLLDSFGGSPYSVGDYFGSAYLDTSGGSASATFQGATAEPLYPETPYGSRGIVRFTSYGDTMMASDDDGGTSAAADGDTRSFITWNNAFLASSVPGSPLRYNFAGAADPGGSAGAGGNWGIGVDYFDMTLPNLFGSVSAPTTIGLDNSAADQDSRVGYILIDRTLTPEILGSSGTHAAGSGTRGMYNGPDGPMESPFWDGMFSSIGLTLFQGSTYVAGWGSSFSDELGTWAPNEAGSNVKSFGGRTVNMNFNFSAIADGTYDGVVDTGLWQHLGGTDALDLTGSNVYPGTSWSVFSGGTNHYVVTVVPEPATMSLVGLALAGFVARRRRK